MPITKETSMYKIDVMCDKCFKLSSSERSSRARCMDNFAKREWTVRGDYGMYLNVAVCPACRKKEKADAE